MTYRPGNLTELKSALADASACGRKVTTIELSAFHRLLEHLPEDMTATVEAGMSLAQLQSELKRKGQWLPIDPPDPERLSIGEVLSANWSGPHRLGHGLIRDHVIGMKVVLADGRVIKAGGKVVKNVAGYDLCKLFIGSRSSLGIIVEATFKLKPVPEAEQFVQARFDSTERAGEFIEVALASELTPVVLDLHNLGPGNSRSVSPLTAVVGFAGAREDVEFQISKARELGADQPSRLDYEDPFWAETTEQPKRRSVLPSEVHRAILGLGPVRFVARAGNGVIYYRGGSPAPKCEQPVKLVQRVKDAFDPKHILPEFPG